MNRLLFLTAFLLGAAAVIWVSSTFLGLDQLALTVTLVIGAVYTIGFVELVQFRQATATLSNALPALPGESTRDFTILEQWLDKLHPSLQNSVRLRIEGERVGLPSPVITPYLVGLLVMLGLLGTFVGMVDTLRGAVFALEGTTELQAIREGLAAPINGLSLAFGTSVAGVATSAMLGLISTLSRRDRMLATRQLDSRAATVLKEFSLGYNRQETFKALQSQAQALPAVAQKLEDMADKLERMSDSLANTLIANQDSFHQSVTGTYTDLASSVDSSLKESLAESGRLAGESIKPLLVDTLAGISKEAENTHQHLTETAREQLTALGGQFERLSASMLESFDNKSSAWVQSQQSSDTDRLTQWTTALEQVQEHALGQLLAASDTFTRELKQLAGLQQDAFKNAASEFETMSGTLSSQWLQNGEHINALASTLTGELGTLRTEEELRGQAAAERMAALGGQFERMSESMLESFESKSTVWLKDQQAGDADRLAHWTNALGQAQEQALGQLFDTSRTFTGELKELTEMQQAAFKTATRDFESMSTALSTQWLQNGENINNLAATLTSELGTLRTEEEQRGEAAVERMAALEATVASHLATLGKELEAPMGRLIETASETPRAAAEVIGQLRHEISNTIERDNQLLEERRQVMEQLNTLSASLEQASAGQREAVEKLVNASTSMLQEVGARFTSQVESELSSMSEVMVNFSGSSSEMASLGEAFSVAVNLYNESNAQLIDSLARIEDSMDKSTLRSDEQMGYYVAQAREILDQSLLSQREVFEELQQLGQQERLTPAEAS